MSIMQRKNRSSLSRNAVTNTSQSRSSARQVKVATQGFYFGESSHNVPAAERDLERVERDLIRKRKKREQRIEELERGNAPSSSWNDGNNFNVPAASTSAAAIAGLLAGRQAEREDDFDDLSNQTLNSTPLSTSNSNNRKKQSSELRRLLTQRRSLKMLLEDASASTIFKSAPNNLLQSLQVSNPYPVHRGGTGPVCSICGYWGDILCMRCQERVCGLKCATTHNETRCDRPI